MHKITDARDFTKAWNGHQYRLVVIIITIIVIIGVCSPSQLLKHCPICWLLDGFRDRHRKPKHCNALLFCIKVHFAFRRAPPSTEGPAGLLGGHIPERITLCNMKP